MSSSEGSTRRGWVAGLAGGAAALLALRGVAQGQATDAGVAKKPGDAGAAPKPHAGHEHHDAAPAPALSPAYKALLDASVECVRAGRVCLSRCTDHLAAGMTDMAACQRAVMNMLAVVEAMTTVASYASADPKLVKQLAKACAAYCRACASACQPHSAHHAECKACEDACTACAKACEAVAA
jgi:Cys-rich four helix bundle protein (predicted Tat secretion target)